MTDTTVVIKTIGRETLGSAIESAVREKFKVIVVSDGSDMPTTISPVKYVRLGRRWGYYGGMAANVGAALAETEFITFLDDDDEFASGAGEVIRDKLKEEPQIDVWIGGVRFNREIGIKTTGETIVSKDLSLDSSLGVTPGNVSMPTYRTNIFAHYPFMNNIPEGQTHLTDFYHIKACELAGFKVAWFGKVLYLVRPIAGGLNGEGQ